MIFPKKLSKDDLRHPADKRSSWNGDRRRPADEQGSITSREAKGLTVTHGTKQPSGIKPIPHTNVATAITTASPTMTYTSGRGPSKAQQAADDKKAREAAQKPLTERQKRLKRGL